MVTHQDWEDHRALRDAAAVRIARALTRYGAQPAAHDLVTFAMEETTMEQIERELNQELEAAGKITPPPHLHLVTPEPAPPHDQT